MDPERLKGKNILNTTRIARRNGMGAAKRPRYYSARAGRQSSWHRRPPLRRPQGARNMANQHQRGGANGRGDTLVRMDVTKPCRQ